MYKHDYRIKNKLSHRIFAERKCGILDVTVINMGKLNVVNHPLITHKLSIMRNKKTGSKDFRELLSEISMFMGYEVTRDLPLENIVIETPITKMNAKMLSGKKITIVPILRAGLGMADGFQRLIPTANVGHIGMYRDHESHEPIEYYSKMPDKVCDRKIIVVDPMLATGGSACDAISLLKGKYRCTDIILVNIVAAPEGVEKVQSEHPDVDIFVAALDERLNEHAYIVPGLGDAGDRIFGTK